jgi:hypothetical protein
MYTTSKRYWHLLLLSTMAFLFPGMTLTPEWLVVDSPEQVIYLFFLSGDISKSTRELSNSVGRRSARAAGEGRIGYSFIGSRRYIHRKYSWTHNVSSSELSYCMRTRPRKNSRGF